MFIGEKGSATGASRHGNNGSPLVDGPHLIAPVGGTHGAGIVCFDKLTGEVVWKSTSDQAGYPPVVVAEIHGLKQVVAYTAAGVISLRRKANIRMSPMNALSRHVTTPIVRGSRVVVSSHQAGLLGIEVKRDGDTWSADTALESHEHRHQLRQPGRRRRFPLRRRPREKPDLRRRPQR